jgi:hypothetical protein
LEPTGSNYNRPASSKIDDNGEPADRSTDELLNTAFVRMQATPLAAGAIVNILLRVGDRLKKALTPMQFDIARLARCVQVRVADLTPRTDAGSCNVELYGNPHEQQANRIVASLLRPRSSFLRRRSTGCRRC